MSYKERKHFLIVGDSACGKTNMFTRFFDKKFIKEHIPTVVKQSVVSMNYDDDRIMLDVLDTDENNYDVFNEHIYSQTQVILMCFSIGSPDSLSSVSHKWSPEMQRLCPGVPIVLIGNKADLRRNTHKKNQYPTDKMEILNEDCGTAMAGNIGAYAYCECSAKLNEGIKEVFETAVKATLPIEQNIDKKTVTCCTLL